MPVVADVLSGQIQAGVPIYIPPVNIRERAGGHQRTARGFLPDIPTARESGIDLVASTWVAVMLARRNAERHRRRLNATVDASSSRRTASQQFAKASIRPLGGAPAPAQSHQSGSRLWAPIIAKENIKLDPD